MKNDPPEEKLRRTFYAIGFAITQWQHVEMALTQLFALLVQSDGGVASAVFNSVPSLPTKLAMIKAAASVRLAPDLAGECVKLCKRIDKKEAKKRNEMAHFTLYQVPVTPGTETSIDWYLAPTAFDGARHWRYKGAIPELKANDLMKRAQEFINLSNEIWEFGEKVRAAQARSPAFAHDAGLFF